MTDTERLDWLERTGADTGMLLPERTHRVIVWDGRMRRALYSARGATLREAIDQAIAKEPPEVF